MRVLVMVKATAESELGVMPQPWMDEARAAMGRFNDALQAAGVLVEANGLKPSSAGSRVWFDGAARTVSAGPFPLTRDLVAGYWIWQVKDMEEAVDWVRRCPNPMPGASEIEVREIWEMEDFG